MRATKAVQGPWRIDRDERPGMEWNLTICTEDGFDVCSLFHDGTPDNLRGEANARLIAAAPALLEAAKGVDVLYAELAGALPEIVGTPGFDRVVAAVEQARAAIRAARGEG